MKKNNQRGFAPLINRNPLIDWKFKMHEVELMNKQVRKELFRDMKAELTGMGGFVFTNEYAGMAIAICPDIGHGKCNMYRVAVSHCKLRDKFKRKIGAIIAMQRLMWDGEYIKIRRETRINDLPYETMASIADDMFEIFNS
jgi:hypothetical protein